MSTHLKTILLAALILHAAYLSAQTSQQDKIAVLPFCYMGVEQNYVQTAESILRIEIEKRFESNTIPKKEIVSVAAEENCFDIDCGLKIGNELNAAQVAGCKLSALGEKTIVQFFLLDVRKKKIVLKDQITAETIEDLDVVMKRIAKSLVEHTPILKNVEVGTIVASEAKKEHRRSSTKNFGVAFGYLYPQNGYDKSDRNFAFDVRIGNELQDFSVGMLLGIRKGFVMNVYGDYLLSKKDICPFVGGAFGFHWITHNSYYSDRYDEYGEEKERKDDGFELTARTGLRLFRTYNFQVIINLAYTYTINDYDDQALLFTIGVL